MVEGCDNKFYIYSFMVSVIGPHGSIRSRRTPSRFGFATLLSMYNKWMFSEGYYGFQFPLFVTTMHMATQFVLAAIVRKVWPQIFKPPGQPTVKEYLYEQLMLLQLV